MVSICLGFCPRCQASYHFTVSMPLVTRWLTEQIQSPLQTMLSPGPKTTDPDPRRRTWISIGLFRVHYNPIQLLTYKDQLKWLQVEASQLLPTPRVGQSHAKDSTRLRSTSPSRLVGLESRVAATLFWTSQKPEKGSNYRRGTSQKPATVWLVWKIDMWMRAAYLPNYRRIGDSLCDRYFILMTNKYRLEMSWIAWTTQPTDLSRRLGRVVLSLISDVVGVHW
jgi:hypothetical protein